LPPAPPPFFQTFPNPQSQTCPTCPIAKQRSSENDLHTVQKQSSQQPSNKLALKDGFVEIANAAVSLCPLCSPWPKKQFPQFQGSIRSTVQAFIARHLTAHFPARQPKISPFSTVFSLFPFTPLEAPSNLSNGVPSPLVSNYSLCHAAAKAYLAP
jgi:hypothetical protein